VARGRGRCAPPARLPWLTRRSVEAGVGAVLLDAAALAAGAADGGTDELAGVEAEAVLHALLRGGAPAGDLVDAGAVLGPDLLDLRQHRVHRLVDHLCQITHRRRVAVGDDLEVDPEHQPIGQDDRDVNGRHLRVGALQLVAVLGEATAGLDRVGDAGDRLLDLGLDALEALLDRGGLDDRRLAGAAEGDRGGDLAERGQGELDELVHLLPPWGVVVGADPRTRLQ
jgi:hypothetical protein